MMGMMGKIEERRRREGEGGRVPRMAASSEKV
jgi:hypothetical protein